MTSRCPVRLDDQIALAQVNLAVAGAYVGFPAIRAWLCQIGAEPNESLYNQVIRLPEHALSALGWYLIHDFQMPQDLEQRIDRAMAWLSENKPQIKAALPFSVGPKVYKPECMALHEQWCLWYEEGGLPSLLAEAYVLRPIRDWYVFLNQQGGRVNAN